MAAERRGPERDDGCFSSVELLGLGGGGSPLCDLVSLISPATVIMHFLKD